MFACMIAPGLFRVRGLGVDINVIADSSASAIIIILEMLT